LAGAVYLIWWPKSSDASWHVVFVLIKDMGWPFVVLISILALQHPLSEFLTALGNSLGRLRTLKIGENFTFSADSVVNVLVEREKLKMGILIAMAEGGIGQEEAGHLARLASPMKNEVQSLSKEQKTEVIEETINMALIDGTIQEQEYVRLQELAELYNRNVNCDAEVDLDNLVMRACYHAEKDPPQQLSQIYAKKKTEWEKEKE
jgi:hypothetical protein